MRFLFPLFLLLSACATAPKPKSDKVPVPSGYYQFCKDFPNSLACPPTK